FLPLGRQVFQPSTPAICLAPRQIASRTRGQLAAASLDLLTDFETFGGGPQMTDISFFIPEHIKAVIRPRHVLHTLPGEIPHPSAYQCAKRTSGSGPQHEATEATKSAAQHTVLLYGHHFIGIRQGACQQQYTGYHYRLVHAATLLRKFGYASVSFMKRAVIYTDKNQEVTYKRVLITLTA